MDENYKSMWEKLGLDIGAHDAQLANQIIVLLIIPATEVCFDQDADLSTLDFCSIRVLLILFL